MRTRSIPLAAKLITAAIAFSSSIANPASSIAQNRVYFTLNNGITIGPALRSDIDTIKKEAAMNSSAGAGAKVIVEADDDLRRVYFHRIQITDGNNERWTIARPQVKIELPNKDRAADTRRSQPITAFAESPQPFEFSDLGRRYYRFSDGKIAVQGITEIAPSYVRVEGLQGAEGDFAWDMRLSLNAIPPETLRAILLRNADPTKARSYLDIVELYETAKRYTEAREMLVYAMQKFPELESNRSSLKRYDQLAADQLFTIADIAKRKAGQHAFAKRVLDSFDYDLLSLETKLKVERQKELAAEEKSELDTVMQWIREDVNQVKDPTIQADLLPVVDEIQTFLTPDTSERFADYRRLRQNTKPESRAALAIGGWLFGPGNADDNISLIASAVKARKIIQDYLGAPTRNDQLLEELSKLESGTPRYVSKIVANMAPPVATLDTELYPVRMQPDPNQPDQLTETTIPGRYLLEVPLRGRLQGQSASYLVQLPPEYNPYRRYPCVVTMHGDISTPEDQINWWCGPADPSNQRCWGEASRNGYIVIAPSWGRANMPNYNYTEDEHMFVLSALFDAKRRFSIDTDRVFLSGHEAGGTGAWDIALAHPDLWAGCLVVCGTVDKYVKQYWPNTRYVPFYFVDGELTAFATKEGIKSHHMANERVWDNLLRDRNYDVLISIYRGRGLDHFQDELPRMIEWMNAPGHVRNFAPDRFEVKTSRHGDRYFWWFETEQLFAEKLVHPLLYRDGSEYKIESRILKESNTVDLEIVPADRYTVNLTADMVDMTQIITVRHKGGPTKRIEPRFDSKTLLRDVRERADRQHPFWVRLEMPR
jgi:pimeloyl-ACP methyl ester carboxylesterase